MQKRLYKTHDEKEIYPLDNMDGSFSFHIVHSLMYTDLFAPIQNFLVDKAASYASESTGMNIKVGRISLSFPLNLVVNDVEASSQHNDTLLSVKRLQVNVQLLPLLKNKWK